MSQTNTQSWNHTLILTFLLSFLCQPLFSQNGQPLFNSYEKMNTTDKQAYLEKNQLKDVVFLELDQSVFKKLNKEKSETLGFALPLPDVPSIEVILKENTIFTDDFIVTAKNSDGAIIVPYEQGLHYYGKIDKESHSMAAFSFFENEIMGVMSLNGASYNLEKSDELSKDGESDLYILYKESDFEEPYNFVCHTPDEQLNQLVLPEGYELHVEEEVDEKMMVNVEVYIECDYKMYQDNGSDITATTNFTAGLFNVVTGIYADAGGMGIGPTMLISETVVWTSQDPYHANTATSSSPVLDAFRCENASYNGRLAHLLSTSNQGLGGLAARPSCPGTGQYGRAIHGFSNIDNFYESDPANYSWSVNVFAHELGHNMSSRHTHDCAWNGNSTQIDDCGNIGNFNGSPACYDSLSPIIPNWGTIMSYCHLNSSGSMGVDLTLGFHSQVDTEINNFAACLSSSILCGAPEMADLTVTNIASTTARLNCANLGASFYLFGYRVAGTGSGISYSGNSNNFKDIMGLSPNTQYEFKVILICSNGASSSSSCGQFFHTAVGCEADLMVDGNPIAADTYQASNFITGTGRVAASTSVDFEAISYIDLSDFEVESMGEFTATTGIGCTPFTGSEEEKAFSNPNDKEVKPIQLIQQDWDKNVVAVEVNVKEDSSLDLYLLHPNGKTIDVFTNSFLEKGHHDLSFDLSNFKLKGPYILVGSTGEEKEQLLVSF